MSRILRVTLASFALVACGPTLSVGQSQSDGGTVTGDDGAVAKDGKAESPVAVLTPVAVASPYLAKCKVVCATPSSGPCASQDFNACVNKCTALTEGLPIACGQCVVEGSGYSGVACDPRNPKTPAYGFGPAPRGQVSDGAACAGPPAPPCPPPVTPPDCQVKDERCDGLFVVKTTDSSCTKLCR